MKVKSITTLNNLVPEQCFVIWLPRILRRHHHHHPSTTGKDGAFIEISSQTPRFAIIHLFENLFVFISLFPNIVR